MQIDKYLFPVNTINLQGSKVLIRLEQADTTKGKNVVLGEKRTFTVEDKILSREVVVEKKSNGKESMKITVKSSSLEGQEKEQSKATGKRPVSAIGQVRLQARWPGWVH